jgi:hypothetical protein
VSSVAPTPTETVGPSLADRIAMRGANAAAMARCIDSYAAAWGPTAPLLALARVRRPSWQQKRA